MEDVSSRTQYAGQGDFGASKFYYASKFVENRNVKEANTNGGDKVSAFATSGTTTSCSGFHSTRMASMLSSRREFETELEFRTAQSKVHWSELSHLEETSSMEDLGREDLGVDHRPYFEKLQKDVHWGGFCNRVTNVVLGKKAGEGAQANIYEAQVTFARKEWYMHAKSPEYVVKLIKGDCTLQDLQCQWPHGVESLNTWDLLLVLHGELVKELAMERNKFGFVIQRYWGDLQSLIA